MLRSTESDLLIPLRSLIENLGKDPGDVVSKGRDKRGYRGEVRLGVAGQGDEVNVVAADGCDAPAEKMLSL